MRDMPRVASQTTSVNKSFHVLNLENQSLRDGQCGFLANTSARSPRKLIDFIIKKYIYTIVYRRYISRIAADKIAALIFDLHPKPLILIIHSRELFHFYTNKLCRNITKFDNVMVIVVRKKEKIAGDFDFGRINRALQQCTFENKLTGENVQVPLIRMCH